MLSHAKRYLRLDLGLQILEQGNARTPTEDDFKVFGDVRNTGKGLQSVEQFNTKTPTQEAFQVLGDVMKKHKCSEKPLKTGRWWSLLHHVKTYEQTDLSLRLQQQHQDTT